MKAKLAGDFKPDRIIGVNPHICFGQPRIIEERLEVWAPVGCFVGGSTIDEVCEDYGITSEQMEECLRFSLMTKRQQEKYLTGLDPFKRTAPAPEPRP
jgi:uncharacterized protein (DUF433 family)